MRNRFRIGDKVHYRNPITYPVVVSDYVIHKIEGDVITISGIVYGEVRYFKTTNLTLIEPMEFVINEFKIHDLTLSEFMEKAISYTSNKKLIYWIYTKLARTPNTRKFLNVYEEFLSGELYVSIEKPSKEDNGEIINT